MPFLYFLLLVILVILLIWIFAVRCRNSHEILDTLRQFRIAHRGLHDETRPENSMSAFRAAIEHGYAIELDVHLSADHRLVVFHDNTTSRLCDQTLAIEQSSYAELQQLFLSDSQEHIPLLEDVLAICGSSTPLVIELKTVNNNASALCERLFEVLDHYIGVFCIKSFDPRVVLWLKRHRNDVCRGQLSTKFNPETANLPQFLCFALQHLLTNFLTVPDFISYEFSHRQKTTSLNICRGVWKAQEFSWVIRSEEELRKVDRLGSIAVFEGFLPSDPK